jgi:nicotinamide riboside kinase
LKGRAIIKRAVFYFPEITGHFESLHMKVVMQPKLVFISHQFIVTEILSKVFLPRSVSETRLKNYRAAKKF